jgi:hypothetical protein
MSLIATWVSGVNGTVSGHPFAVGSGALQQVSFLPNLGATQPSNSYSVTVQDASGGDVAIGKGLNLSNAAEVIGVQNAPLSWLQAGTLDINVTAAGNAKSGTVTLTIARV